MADQFKGSLRPKLRSSFNQPEFWLNVRIGMEAVINEPKRIRKFGEQLRCLNGLYDTSCCWQVNAANRSTRGAVRSVIIPRKDKRKHRRCGPTHTAGQELFSAMMPPAQWYCREVLRVQSLYPDK